MQVHWWNLIRSTDYYLLQPGRSLMYNFAMDVTQSDRTFCCMIFTFERLNDVRSMLKVSAINAQ